jgi:hypothetical protein
MVEVINYAYSKYDNNGGLFPVSHFKRGHIRSFKKLANLDPNMPIKSPDQSFEARPKLELSAEDKAFNFL